METNTTVERRIDRPIRFLRLAGALCAMFAAVGIGHGIHQANPDGGWFVPILAGLVAATALAIFWHVVIGMVVGMVRKTMLVALFAVAAIVTVVALGASAQAIATAVAGRAALSAELSAQVDDYNQRLAKAFGEATSWSGVAEAAGAKAAGLDASRPTAKRTAAYGSGKGCGPRCNSLRDTGGGVRQQPGRRSTACLQEAKRQSRRQARRPDERPARSPPPTPIRTASWPPPKASRKPSRELNAIDPRPIIDNIGAVPHDGEGHRPTPRRRRISTPRPPTMPLPTARASIAPVFMPMSIGEATRRQILGAAMHGWILASAIDLLPFFFLILGFVLSREVWLNEEVVRERPTTLDKDKADREGVG